jgi:hypothetical protein
MLLASAGPRSLQDNRAVAVDRQAVTSYYQMRPGAPHHRVFDVAWQAFTAQSNRITYLAATVGVAGYNNDGHTVRVRLRTTSDRSQVLGETNPQVVNYGKRWWRHRGRRRDGWPAATTSSTPGRRAGSGRAG